MCFTIWFTGMSSAGKTTLSQILYNGLKERNKKVELLDGDDIRSILGKKIGYDKYSREANILYLGLLSYFLNRNGIISIVAAISPYKEARENNRKLIRKLNPFIEVYCKCELDILEQRDIKGLYKLAREGKIKNFTGINDPYENPDNPEIILNTDLNSIEYCNMFIINYLKDNNLIS
jgi:adenylylsulfate kinase